MPYDTEILDAGDSGLTVYAVLRSRADGRFWNGTAMELFSTGHWSSYAVGLPELAAGSGFYVFTAPGSLPPDDYDLIARQQAGGFPNISADATISEGVERWDGSRLWPLSTDVSAQIDASFDTPLPEMVTGQPPKNPTFKEVFTYFWMRFRNQHQTTISEDRIMNDAGVVIAKASLSDDGSVAQQNKWQAGP